MNDTAETRRGGQTTRPTTVTNGDRCQIRFATTSDVPRILNFIRQLAEYERMADRVVADENVLRESLFGPHPAAEVLLCEVDGRPVGFALFFHNYSTFLGRAGIYLEDLFVEPDFRGRGFGRALMQRVAQLAVQRNCCRLEWAVLDWNRPAIDFYKALSAEAMSDWTVFRLSSTALNNLADLDESAST